MLWKSLAFMGYPAYEVSEAGEVWSVRRKLPLKGGYTDKGYHLVTLYNNGKGKGFHVHVLVALAFLGPKPTGAQVRHLDGNATNNNVHNLSWGTAKENSADRVRHGTQARGEVCSRSGATADGVRRLRLEYANGNLGYQLLARKYNMTKSQVYQIIKRKVWKHVE